MHIRTGADLLPLDTELEKTIRLKKEKTTIEVSVMADEREANHNVPVVTTNRP